MSRSRALLLAIVVVLGGCDPSGPDFGPPTALTKGALPSSLVVGQTIDSVRVTVKDKDGKKVSGAQVSWTASAGTVSPTTSETDEEGVAVTAWTLGTTSGSQTLTAAVEDLETTFHASVDAAALSRVALDLHGATLHAVLDTVRLSGHGEDTYGNVTGGPLSWQSTNPGIATVVAGVVVARSDGTVSIIASSGAVADTAVVAVDQVVAGLEVTGPYTVLALDETWPYRAMAVDSNGFEVDTAMTVAWSTSSAAVVSVDAGGQVTAAGVGTADLTAAALPFEGTLALEVRQGPRASITGVSPDLLVAGDTITITGTDFAAIAADNVVRVADVEGTVLSGTSAQLTVELAPPESYPCVPRALRSVVVSVNGLEATTEKEVAVAPRTTLGVGESAALFDADVRCLELTEAGSYVLSVVNTFNTPDATSAFLLRGTGATSAAAAPRSLATAAPVRNLRVADAPPAIHPRPDEVAHLRLLDENIRLGKELSRAMRQNPAPDGMLRAVAAAAAPTVGEVRSFRMPDLDATGLCSNYVTIDARAVKVGDHGVVWEDTTAPLVGQMDDTWQQISDEFDDVMYDVLLQNFGDPLIYDSQLDDNGLFFMVFSNKVNDLDTNVAGFVFSGDMFPRSDCESSDLAEIFYGIVPTDPGTGFDGHTAKAWLRTMRSTVIHEVKHITSFATRISTEGVFEDSWLEESTARLAEELYARRVFGYAQGDNTGYQESVYCEVRPTWDECTGRPWVMGKHFLALMDYYASIERLSPLGKTRDDDYTFYGSGWLFVRWAIDQSGIPEPDFIKALVSEGDVTGTDNIEARTGRSFAAMLADFSLAVATDDDPAGLIPADPALSFPTWRVRDIFSGFSTDFPDDFPDPFPLLEHDVGFGDFSLNVGTLRGGSASIFRLTGTMQGSQLLELLSADGGPAPARLGLALVRVE